MAGNSSRRGAVRKGKKGATVGSGGVRRRGLEGKGPTPKAEERPNHKKYAGGSGSGAAGRRGGPKAKGKAPGSDQVAGRNAVLEALREEIPATQLTLMVRIDADERVREIMRLAAARALKSQLERTGRYKVVMTRDADVYVDHAVRVQIARRADADLFISLHADSGSDPTLRGASVYTLADRATGRSAKFVSKDDWFMQAGAEGDRGVSTILLDLTQRMTRNRSATFAEVLLERVSDHQPLLRRSHREAGLAVLLAPDVPAVLLEMGFITNPEDERLLTDERARRRLMKSVAESIDRYYREPSAPLMTASNDGAGRP